MFFLIAKDNEWAGLLSSLDMFSDAFMSVMSTSEVFGKGFSSL